MTRDSVRLCFGLPLLIVTALGAPARGQSLQVLPAEVQLDGPAARQKLLLQQTQSGITLQQVEHPAWTVADAQVVRLEGDTLVPLADGTTTVSGAVDGNTATANVTVRGLQDAASPDWSFRNHVQPVFSKAGCNSGACHGALAGKGGFKLSLRGYDPFSDYLAISQQSRGRRMELSDPGRSLILAKPSGALPHRGGLRLEVDTPDYRVVAEWIAAGAAPPSVDDPELATLEILPAAVRLPVGARQQIVVRAHYSDGRVEDVTSWCKFSAANEAVTQVAAQGEVNVIGPGVGAVTAWFSSQIAICNITVPYDQQVDARVFEQAPRNNFIDQLVLQQLELLNLPPSPPAGDAEFLRRAFLDTIGALPTVPEVRSFLADPAVDKRQRLIDQLLNRGEFVDYWTYRWSDLLLVNSQLLRPDAVKSFHFWIRENVAQNTPWDQFVRSILVAQGDTLTDGATNFYALHQDPEDMTENASQAFLGLSIGCAKCHNHPLEKWTNDQYYAMANLFARVRAKGWGGDVRSGDGRRTVYVAARGDLIQPLRGKPQPPTPLDGQPIGFDDETDRREHLADWMTSAENPYFSRAITNRVWANFFGVGLIESVDDLRVSNPASNEVLLSAAANYLAGHDFDLKALMRVILQSAAYQRSSEPLSGNRAERRFYSHYYPKRLMAEVMLDAISQVSAEPTIFDTIEYPGADREKTSFYPAGTRAIQLFDSAVGSYFLRTFGRNQRRITCECERSDEPSLVQALHLANGDTLNRKLAKPDNRIGRLLRAATPAPELLDELYLAALARLPTQPERQQAEEVLREAPADSLRIVWEDIFWSVLSSREFLFNH